MDPDEITYILKQTLRQQLDTPESTMVEAIQRILFTEHGIDVRRVEIKGACRDLFRESAPAQGTTSDEKLDDDEIFAATEDKEEANTLESGIIVSLEAETTVVTVPPEDLSSSSDDPLLELHLLLDNPSRFVTGRKPREIRLPDGSKAQVKSWSQLVRTVIGWLVITTSCPPIPVRLNGSLSTFYILNNEPRHQNTVMVTPFEFIWEKHTLFAEMNQSGKKLLASLVQILLNTGHTTSNIAILLEDDNDGIEGADTLTQHLGLEIAETLRHLSVPTHFEKIAEEYNRGKHERTISPQKVRARLMETSDLFAHLGEGIYALKEWGVSGQGTRRSEGMAISAILLGLLEECDEPMEFADLCASVMARRTCKETSIRGCLANDDRFCSFGRGRYGLKRWVT